MTSKGKQNPPSNLHSIIERLLQQTTFSKPCLTREEIIYLCQTGQNILMRQPMLLELNLPMKVCGDIHGHFSDLTHIFSQSGSPEDTRYLFLGDYVDRGDNSIDTMCLLLAYKIQNQKSFFLLRGNHESEQTNVKYGFLEECKTKYDADILKHFVSMFMCMPVAARLGKKVFCVHGGLSPELRKVEQINSIQRPVEIPESGLLCDLMWADPSDETDDWEDNTGRNMSFVFGRDVTSEFMQNNNLKLICRAHELEEKGWKKHFDEKVITIFSAPNYCKNNNSGAILNIDVSLNCQLEIFKTVPPQEKLNKKKR